MAILSILTIASCTHIFKESQYFYIVRCWFSQFVQFPGNESEEKKEEKKPNIIERKLAGRKGEFLKVNSCWAKKRTGLDLISHTMPNAVSLTHKVRKFDNGIGDEDVADMMMVFTIKIFCYIIILNYSS